MEPLDVLRVGLRFSHVLAALVWIGGSLFYVLALDPAVARIGRTPERAELLVAIGREFRQAVRVAIAVLVFSGALLTFDRLSQPRVPGSYVVLLGLKIALALWMFWLARRLERRDAPRGKPGPAGPQAAPRRPRRAQGLLLTLGLLVFLLAIVLRMVWEVALGEV